MTPELCAKISEYKQKFIAHSGNIIEFGSLNPSGGVRHLFPDASDYVGLDLHRGPGVDILMDYHRAEKYFEYQPDTILCLNVLQRDLSPWSMVKSMRELLIKGGFLIISTPTNGSTASRETKDYFRLLPDAYTDWFFDGMEILDLTQVKTETGGTICGIAKKPYKIKHDSKNNSGYNFGYCW